MKRILPAMCCVLIVGSGAVINAEDGAPVFRAPVQLTSGDAPMGQGVLYPSPKMQDIDGDGSPEMLIGDLRGYITVAKRAPSGSATAWGPPEQLKTADGEYIKFDNW